MRRFIAFAFISGVGWLCDFLTFTLLISSLDINSFFANFVSSYVGVTFVWFASLKTVFEHDGAARSRHLLFYWGFQFLSILTYSKLLQLMVSMMVVDLPSAFLLDVKEIGKIIITPFNLFTNFIFMRLLVRCICRKELNHV